MNLIVKVKKIDARGPEFTAGHILKPKIERDGGNEMGIEERLIGTYSNLPFPIDRKNKYSISTQLEAAAYQCRKYTYKRKMKDGTEKEFSTDKVKQIILSFGDSLDTKEREYQASIMPNVAKSYIDTFAPGAAYWMGIHADRNHLHCHVLVANWSPVLGHGLNWSPDDLAHMNSCRWLPEDLKVVIEPGAFCLKEKSSKSYNRSEAILNLVGLICSNPEGQIKELKVEKCKSTGGAPSVRWKGKKIGVKALNHELRKQGFKTGLDEAYKNKELTEPYVSDTFQQTRIDLSLGIGRLSKEDFDRFCDLPDPYLLAKTAEEHRAITEYLTEGKITSGHHAKILARLTRTAIARKIMGHTKPRGHEPKWVYDEKETPLIIELMKPLVNDMFLACHGHRNPFALGVGQLSWNIQHLVKDLVKLWDRVTPPEIPL